MRKPHALLLTLAAAAALNGALAQVPQPAAEPGSVPEAQPAGTVPAERGQGPTPPVRVAGGVVAGMKIGGDRPVYPPDAKAKGVSGAVVLHAVIGKDGHVENLTVVSGDPLLCGAAVDAVQTWVYKPFMLNGAPTEVDTTVTVNFNMRAGPAGAAAGAPPGGLMGGYAPQADTPAMVAGRPVGPVRISSGVISGLKVSGDAPVYPPDARAAHVGGSVVLHAIVGRDGHVASLTVVSGSPMLADAALDAVKTWVYKPYLLNGAPTEVDTTITVNFNLAPEF